MSLLLYSLGRISYRRPFAFIAVWFVVLAGVIGITVAGGGVRISSAITIDGTESQRVLDDLRARLPAAAGGQGTIVFTAPAGERLDQGARGAAIAAAVKDIARLPYVVDRPAAAHQAHQGQPAQDGAPTDAQPQGTAPTGPQPPARSRSGVSQPGGIHPLVVDAGPVPGVIVSADGSVAMLQLQFTQQVEDLPDGSVEQVVDLARADTGAAGVEVLTTESLKPHTAPLGGPEVLGLGVAAIILFLTLGSLRAAGLPLLTALVGVGVGLGGALALSHTITLTTATPVLALMVGLAVGIDYALFIINRQRRLILTRGLSAEEAASRAVGTAGSAVLFAGLTVVIALTGLVLIEISFLTTMALVAAVTVALAVLVALTLLPALLGLVGERIASPKARARGAALTAEELRRFAHRWSGAVVRRRWLTIIGVVAVLGVATVPAMSMSLGMPDGSTANLDTSERQAYDAITRGFGEGYNAPLVVTAHPGPGQTFTPLELGRVASELTQVPGVVTAGLRGVDATGTTAILSVIPTEGPDAASTADLVDRLRASGASVVGPGATIGVTGLTAVNLDISQKLADVLPRYLAIVVALSLVVLLLVFRSVLIPFKATVGFLLTIGATFGVVTAVFQWGWLKELFGFDTTGPILSFLPIMVTGILYGLAMDYEMFLVSSMREAHVHGHRGSDSIVHGFDQAGRVVVAAAIIMVSVFAGFVFSEDPMVKQFGLALAVGILVDALLVRLTLVPAVMAVLGRVTWWLPGWLSRILPNLDVEGDRLEGHLSSRVDGAPEAERTEAAGVARD